MPEQTNLFNKEQEPVDQRPHIYKKGEVGTGMSWEKPKLISNSPGNENEFKKFVKKMMKEGYTRTKRTVDGNVIETFTRRK